MGARRRVVFCSRRIVKLCGGVISVKFSVKPFPKGLRFPKAAPLGRLPQQAKYPIPRRALRKGLNLQNDPVDRFAKRGNPAREGSPLLANFTNYPFTEQVKTAYLDLVSSRLPASQNLTKSFDLYAYPAGTSFCSCASSRAALHVGSLFLRNRQPYNAPPLLLSPTGRATRRGPQMQNTLGDTPRPHAPERPLGTAMPSRSVG